MPHYMSSGELRKVKKGDQLFIHGRYYTVTSAGHKWVRCDGLRQRINVEVAHLESTGYGTGEMYRVFRTDTLHKLDVEANARMSRIFAGIRRLNADVYSLTKIAEKSPEALDMLEDVLKKLDYLPNVRK